MMQKHAICLGCGIKHPLKLDAEVFPDPPSGWVVVKGRRYCSTKCVFEAKRRGTPYPEPVTERDIFIVDGEGSVMSMIMVET